MKMRNKRIRSKNKDIRAWRRAVVKLQKRCHNEILSAQQLVTIQTNINRYKTLIQDKRAQLGYQHYHQQMNHLKKKSTQNSQGYREWINKTYHKPRKQLELGAITNNNGETLAGPAEYLKYIHDFWETTANPKTTKRPILNARPPLDPTPQIIYAEEDVHIRKSHFPQYVTAVVNDPQFPTKFFKNQPNTDLNRPFTPHELNQAINQTPNKKSTGPLGIPYELLKLIHKTDSSFLLNLYNKAWENERIPDDWGHGTLVLLYKGKNTPRDKLTNYRPITLLTTLWKTYMKLINNRLMQYLRENKLISPFQAGFQKRKGCLQHVAAITEICRRRKYYKKKTILTFFDISKAYDSVPQNELWYKMGKIGVGGKMLNVIREMYSHQHSSVKTPLGISDPYQMSLGVRQGCVLSPTLFNIYINDIFEHTHWNPVMCNPPKRKPKRNAWTNPVHMFLYADDIVTLCDNIQDHKNMLLALENWANKWGLKFKPAKCATLIIDTNKQPKQYKNYKPTIHNEPIPIKHKQRYLGIIFNDTLTWSDHITEIKKRGNFALLAMTPFLRNKRVPIEHKIRIIKESLIPTMLWGSEIFIHSKKDCNKLQTITNNAIRQAIRLGSKSNAVIPMLIETTIPLIWLQIVRRKQLMLNRWIQTQDILIHKLLKNINDTAAHTQNSIIIKMIKVLQQHNIHLRDKTGKTNSISPQASFIFQNECPKDATLFYNFHMYAALQNKCNKIKAHQHYMQIKHADAITTLESRTDQYRKTHQFSCSTDGSKYQIEQIDFTNYYNSKTGSVKAFPKYTAPFYKRNITLTQQPTHLHSDLDDNSSIISENEPIIQESKEDVDMLETELINHPIPLPQNHTNSHPPSYLPPYIEQPTLTPTQVYTPITFCKDHNLHQKYMKHLQQMDIKQNPEKYDQDITNLETSNLNTPEVNIIANEIKEHNAGNRPNNIQHTRYFEIPFAVSRLIFQLRTRCLPLASQLVMYGYLPIEYKSKCPCCQIQTKETMEHFLFECKALNANINNHLPFDTKINKLHFLLSDTILMNSIGDQCQPTFFALYDRLVQRQKILNKLPEYTKGTAFLQNQGTTSNTISYKPFTPTVTPPLSSNDILVMPTQASAKSSLVDGEVLHQFGASRGKPVFTTVPAPICDGARSHVLLPNDDYPGVSG